MDYLNTQAQIRPCGSSWEYCDGICNGCAKSKIITSDTTNQSNWSKIPKQLLDEIRHARNNPQ